MKTLRRLSQHLSIIRIQLFFSLVVGHIICANLRYNNVLYRNVNVGPARAEYKIFTFTAFVHETMFNNFHKQFRAYKSKRSDKVFPYLLLKID